MKLSIIAITLLFLICLSTATSFMKRKKVKKSQTATETGADYGSGTWAGGYVCPELRVAEGNAEYKVEGRGTFLATRLESPVTDQEKLGWVFTMEGNLGTTLLKIFTRVGTTNQYYLPFRLISSAAKYTNPVGYKFIEFWVTSDEKKLYRFRVNLPWAYVGWFINDEEGNKICTLINDARTKKQSTVNSAKVVATSASSEFITNKTLLNAASATGASLEKTKTELTAKVATLNAQITSTKAQKDAEEIVYNGLNSQSIAQTAKVNELSATLFSINDQIKAINETLKTLGSSTTSNAGATAALKTKVDTALASLKSDLTVLSGLAPTKAADIASIETTCLALDQTTVNTKINGIAPVSS